MDQDSRRIRKTLSMRFARKGAKADIDDEGSKKSGTKRKCEEVDNDDENSIKACAKQQSRNPIPLQNEVGSLVNSNGSSIDLPKDGEIDVQVSLEEKSTPDEDSIPHSHDEEPNICYSSCRGNLQNTLSDDQDSEVEDPLPVNKETILADVLKDWAIETNIAYGHVDSLLKKLKPHFPTLPASHKTLLDMNSGHMFEVRKFDPHNDSDNSVFVYFGIRKILEIIVKPSLHIKNPVLKLQFNADGMKLDKSSPLEFWAMQGKIHTENEVTYDPFLICVWHGEGKPSSADLFVEEFVIDLNHLLSEGLTVEEVHVQVKCHCFICDRPARAFLKKINGHTGFFSCERCFIAGLKPRGTTIFPYEECALRTMLSFLLKVNSHHHKGTSPLLAIKPDPPDERPLDLVKLFILDFMHLGPLTNMKNLLLYWTTESGLKIPQQDIDKICKRLKNISKQIPEEFQRSTKSLETLPTWKATEYRFFLLYCGFLVLKGILPEAMYKHFLLFAVSSRILSSDELIQKFMPLAKIYLKRCAQLYPQVYGEDSQTLYAHSLVHIADDVEEMGCNISFLTAFPFENNLKKVKSCLRSPYKPLQQLCTQVERELRCYKGPKIYKDEVFLSKKKSGDDKVLIDSVMFHHCKLSCKSPNNIMMLNNGDVVRIVQLYHESNRSNEILFKGEELVVVGDAFTYPMSSSSLGIYEIKDSVVEIISSSLDQMRAKMVLLSIFEEYEDTKIDYVVPLLHT
ncbi:hypothetical protein QAD02_000782 [Eretmocerus hayati]|uniref:Uncharacterized protein n=1 Tax=Eretmocerus hayati TaxID=131215 RepID=A0ACC2NF18_9HYME|nr:hypothetical protein QAD02_000782 [Eretmocerus hayati]